MQLDTRRSLRHPLFSRLPRLGRSLGGATLAITLATAASAQLSRSLPESLTDHEFWNFFTTMSEDGGTFPSENFVSNEQTYQYVIPTLQRTLTPNGVYLGVGPEQNFTYIANLKPRMAVIFDIRRQNAMAHLMYKALFEMSPTRADFVARLFSRPLPASLGTNATAMELFNAALDAKMSDSAFDANREAIFKSLVVKHGFALTTTDSQSIKHVYASFFEAGPDINYGYRFGSPNVFRPMYSTYAQIQTLTNLEGVNMAFLGSEANYQYLRAMHGKNLVVPVVGDFAGPKAIRGVGDYLKQRHANVMAFYLSNVEQYLFRGPGDSDRFYANVSTLPIDSTSTFIRSVPPSNGLGGIVSIFSGGLPFGVTTVPNNYYSVQVVRDSTGKSIIQITSDSAGKLVTTQTVDSSGARRSPLDIFKSLRARDDSIARARTSPIMRVGGGMNAGTLISGTASIRETLDAYVKGQLAKYEQAIAMTKVDGWK